MPTSHFSNHLPSNLETFIKTLCFVSESCPIYVVYRIETGPLTQSVWIICLLPGSEMPPSQKRLKLLEEKKITFLRNIPAFSLFFFGEEGGSLAQPPFCRLSRSATLIDTGWLNLLKCRYFTDCQTGHYSIVSDGFLYRMVYLFGSRTHIVRRVF